MPLLRGGGKLFAGALFAGTLFGLIATVVAAIKRQARRIYIFRAIEDLFVRAKPTEEKWIKN